MTECKKTYWDGYNEGYLQCKHDIIDKINDMFLDYEETLKNRERIEKNYTFID
jgi:hypothetical protein